ncbi:alpha-hydroxyketone-type quorum-sensing autoinducer synthase [Vibrio coralliilyticus]|uniref:alpha-hydroxyketone-type quorum-sensing autoinducer synthase n=1 Tax=Vibrio coralliilyticus TaxID=190893 RepID=UPI000BAAC2C4|nr:alpha-hydroxyketone-type quorum-sensing autoinducer synthase [Vibrio coralliilyticus]NOI60687.1 quorum-sensing autoinducer synthase [Vibrio coralliilyticus]PAT69131.1 CAI-1 autoinducer synthase [Vibrio coralliilyticus]
MNTLNHYPPLPDFINNKINFYLDDLINTNKNGKHLVLGKRPQSGDLVLQSNDYLDLSNNPDIIDHHISSIMARKNSPFMSGIFLQDESSKPEVEEKLAKYVGFQSCLLSQSGWAANTALLQTICDSETNVYIDFFAHMSLWEGARIAGANIHPFMHNNVKHLNKLINRHGPGIVLVDSVYSTIGTIAPLVELVLLAKEYGCAILVDESHSLGTHGKHGAGLLQSLKLSHQVDFMTASLAKTFAYRAGAIWCNNRANDCVPFVAYPAIFSSTMLPHELDRLDKTLDIIKEKDKERAYLQELSEYLKNNLANIGLTIRSQSQIIAVETGDERNTEKVRDFFESQGIFGAVFCRPATTPNKNIIRFSLNSSTTKEEVNKIIRACQMAYELPDMYFI